MQGTKAKRIKMEIKDVDFILNRKSKDLLFFTFLNFVLNLSIYNANLIF
jgi:hypothetical protein